MRIISKFKDYYDVVAGQGIDMTRVFLRETQELKGTFPFPGWEDRHSWRRISQYPKIDHAVYHSPYSRGGTQSYELGYIYVLFAGKLYGGLALKDKRSGPKFNEITYYWDVDSWQAKADEINFIGRNKLFYNKNSETEAEECLRLVAIKGDEVLSSWAIGNKISIAVACEFYSKDREDYYKINPCLKDLNFQKVLDPFTAYQELEMWVGGVIGQNPEPDEVSDSVKIQQHGFDKWSFRKHKLDNK